MRNKLFFACCKKSSRRKRNRKLSKFNAMMMMMIIIQCISFRLRIIYNFTTNHFDGNVAANGNESHINIKTINKRREQFDCCCCFKHLEIFLIQTNRFRAQQQQQKYAYILHTHQAN